MSGDFQKPLPPWFPTYEGRPVRRLTLDKRTANFQDFFKWIQDSYSSIYRQIADDSNDFGQMLEQLTSVLIRELDSGQIAKRRTALKLIDQIVTNRYGHEAFFTVVHASLQNRVLSAVVRCLVDPSPTVRREAILTLSGVVAWWQPQLVKPLVKYGVNNTDAQVALSAIELLGRVEINLRSLAVPSLTLSLSHKSDRVRQAACDALGALGSDANKAVRQVMAIAISNSSDAVRYAAIECMLQIQEYQDTVNDLHESGTKLERFVDFLRAGGERFKKLRQDLEAYSKGPRKHAAKVANGERKKKPKSTPGRKANIKRDCQLLDEFENGKVLGHWKKQSEFAFHKKIQDSTLSHAFKRAREAKGSGMKKMNQSRN